MTPEPDTEAAACPECGAPATSSHGTWHPSGTRGTCYVYACGFVVCACPARYDEGGAA